MSDAKEFLVDQELAERESAEAMAAAVAILAGGPRLIQKWRKWAFWSLCVALCFWLLAQYRLEQMCKRLQGEVA